LDEFTGIIEVSDGVVEPNVIVTPTIAIGVDPLKGVIGECVVHISPSVEVSIGTAVSVVLVGLPKDISTIITAWDVRVVPESIAISVSPLEWVFPERIDRVNKTIAVIIRTASSQCIGRLTEHKRAHIRIAFRDSIAVFVDEIVTVAIAIGVFPLIWVLPEGISIESIRVVTSAIAIGVLPLGSVVGEGVGVVSIGVVSAVVPIAVSPLG
jgi:hypothetical protein